MPSSRVAQKEDTRRRLLMAARRLFRSSGVEAVSMEDIANASKVSRATVYLHFPGKAALLEALLDEDWDGQVRLFEKLRKSDVADPDKLDRWIARVAEGMVRTRDSFSIHRAALGQNPDLTIRHQQHRQRLATILLSAIDGTSKDSRAERDRAIEAELMIAELEYFATAAALNWSPEQVSSGAVLIAGRLRAFAGVDR